MNKCIDNIRFAVEIEVEFPSVKDSYDLIAKNRLIRGWEMDMDGSLDNGAEYRALDKNKLYWNEDCIDQIKEIIGLIKAHKGHIRPTCGLHVHVDMKNFTNREILHIMRNFTKKQNKIYKKFKVLKSRYETAQKISNDSIKKLNVYIIKKIKKAKTEFEDKYYGLNINSLGIHNTLEFRFFNFKLRLSAKIRVLSFLVCGPQTVDHSILHHASFRFLRNLRGCNLRVLCGCSFSLWSVDCGL